MKGKKEYTLCRGDYILFNGACWTFTPRNNSELPMDKWFRCTHLLISKVEAKRLIKTNLTKEKKDGCLHYYFFI